MKIVEVQGFQVGRTIRLIRQAEKEPHKKVGNICGIPTLVDKSPFERVVDRVKKRVSILA